VHPRFVVLRTSTDPTGHVDVEVVSIIEGEHASERAWKEAERLNREVRVDNMEVYIVRPVGG
jgi:hypothetical protein